MTLKRMVMAMANKTAPSSGMMDPKKEEKIRSLVSSGYNAPEIARRMNSNTQMVRLWLKMLKLEPMPSPKPFRQVSTGVIETETGLYRMPDYRYDTPDQVIIEIPSEKRVVYVGTPKIIPALNQSVLS